MSDHHKKLIEVALPLDEINSACKAYKDRKVGTIRNLHKWFAPMPLPAWRAILYAALIDDPGDDEKRAYHLDVIKRLVANGADLPDSDTVAEARRNIARQFPDGPPTVMDPFCGGGSTLIEAQRLGLRTFGSDLNPVPVLISRTLTQLLPRVMGQRAVHPSSQSARDGLLPLQRPPADPANHFEEFAQDVEAYALDLRQEAWNRLQTHYPSPTGEVPVAWLWARSVTCPNPSCGIDTVLTTSWWLSKKAGQLAWIEPKIDDGRVILEVLSDRRSGKAPDPPKVGRGAAFNCLACGQTISDSAIRGAGQEGRLGTRMVAVVTQGSTSRTYRAPTELEIEAASSVKAPDNLIRVPLGPASQYMAPPRYGLTQQADLYTPRQALALSVFADLIQDLPTTIRGQGGSDDWAAAITTMLGLAVGKAAQANSTQVRWNTSVTGSPKAEPAFGRNDVPMFWDFVETNPFGRSVGSFEGIVTDQLRALRYVARGEGATVRADARTAISGEPALIATDPPYFDAIGYADLADYFYLWHRRALRDLHPDLYQTVATPKEGELTAFPWQHGNSREKAKDYFIEGFTETFLNLRRSMAPGLPMIVVYASKEKTGGSEEESRWSSILTAIVASELEITGTWPIHGTTAARLRGNESNAVATYVAMIARPRPEDAPSCSLVDLNRSLRRELKPAVHGLQAAGILPLDLAQAAMGPGMQVYSRYRAVLDQYGHRVTVDQALRLINQALGEVLDEQEGDLDPDSRFAVTWWEKHWWDAASFGEADQLARPHGIAVDDVVRAGVASYPRPGFVRVVGGEAMNREWDPMADSRPTAWEAVHHLADRLIDGGGVSEAGALMARLDVLRDPAQGLVYRLHSIAARKGWTRDQERYNALIGSWSDLLAEAGRSHGETDGLF